MRRPFESLAYRTASLKSSFPNPDFPAVTTKDMVKAVGGDRDNSAAPTMVCSAGRGPVRLLSDRFIENRPFTLTREQWLLIFG